MPKHKGKPNGMRYSDVLAQRRMLQQSVQQAANDNMVALQSDIRVQRMMWLMICSVSDAFGVGAQRMLKFFDALQANSDEYDRMATEVDVEYANEKLRQKAEKISGVKIKYLYEEEMKAAKKANEARGVFFQVEVPENGAPV